MNTIEKRERAAELAKELRCLNAEIHKEEQGCQHDFADPVYDPEGYQKGEFDHYEPHGSDPEPVYRYHTESKARWSRTCKKCGKKEYTYHQKPVGFVPDFDNQTGPSQVLF